jgi:hypothetical protein
MLTIAEEIKDRLDIVAFITSYVPLEKAGRSYKALCPFHNEKTPSFVVFPETGTWRCFGACQTGGDIFDFYMRRERTDFPTALRELARKAGVTLGTPEQAAAYQAKRSLEDALAAALTHFQATLAANAEAAAYVAGRGWNAATVAAAGLGYFDGDWHALRVALAAAGIAAANPGAAAVLKMPPGLLIYPHIVRGRVRYLAGRSITAKRHWNLPADLVGAKQPYYNHVWRAGVPLAIVVEGQADAITCAHWDIPAVALAGCASTDRDLLADLARCGAVAVGLDADPAGQTATADLVAGLLKAGLTAVRIRTLAWPAKDANAWLQTAHPAPADVQALLAAAPTWLDAQLARAAELTDTAERDAATYQVFALLPALSSLELGRRKRQIADSLDLPNDVFDSLLRAARRDAGLTANGQPQYSVVAGRLCRRAYSASGDERLEPLANFQARIVADVVDDDGEAQERRFIVEGSLADGPQLPRIEIEASEFGQMTWPLIRWGAHASIAAGSGSKEHLRAAIQSNSKQVERRYEYSHLGWRKINTDGADRMIYLSAAGALGMEGVQVRLIQDLAAYRLPIVAPADPLPAVQASLRFLSTGEHAMTVPLWAAVYLAPLSGILNPAFTIWLFGTTGSLKSTATALAMCHYGRFAYNTPPASWTGTTNALEMKAFLVKDAPLWIDDFVTQSTIAGTNELKAKADQLLRDWGNRAGRSRMNADLKLRRTFVPRGLVISTAEQLPPGQSILSRLFAVEATPTMMSRGQDSPLSQAQQHDAPLYPAALAGYLTWLADRYDQLAADLPERLYRYTEAARSEGAHLRMPANVAALFIGYELGLDYALAAGALAPADHAALRQTGWRTLLELAEKQNLMVVEEKPVELYLTALEQMLAVGAIYLRHRDRPDEPNAVWPITRTPQSEFLGWYDDFYYYLLPKIAFGAVWRFYRAAGVVYPDTERGVREKLLEQHLLFPQPDARSDRYTYRLPLGAEMPRVLRIARTKADASTSPAVGTPGEPGANQLAQPRQHALLS